MSLTWEDKTECATQIQNWAYFRDQGRWEELAETFSEDGIISVTWFSGAFPEFIEQSKAMFQAAKPPRSKHFMGPSMILGSDTRALGESNAVIMGSFLIEGRLCEGRTYVRYLDRLRKDARGWRIRDRVAIYERDCMAMADGGSVPASYLETFPAANYPLPYRFLAARMMQRGRQIVGTVYCDGEANTLRLLNSARTWAGI